MSDDAADIERRQSFASTLKLYTRSPTAIEFEFDTYDGQVLMSFDGIRMDDVGKRVAFTREHVQVLHSYLGHLLTLPWPNPPLPDLDDLDEGEAQPS